MKFLLVAITLIVSLNAAPVHAHCEVPCGIFDDEARFDLILENAVTIEKAMNEINTLSDADKPDFHTIARWTATKEEHAIKIQEIISRYFLAQRVKLPKQEGDEAYVKHLTLLHELMVAAMRTKQSTDTARVETLRKVTGEYREHYFSEHGHEH